MKRRWVQEFFSYPDITIMTGIVTGGIFFLFPYLNQGMVWFAIGVGALGYAVSEYLVHRFLFHLPPPKRPSLLRLLKRLHYDHHSDPDNKKLLFLPLWYSLPLISIATVLAYAVVKDVAWTVAFAVGVMAYLLYYEWAHFVAHRPLRPVTPWGRFMKKNHLLHHFKNERYWFGVTHPFLDQGLGTWPREKFIPRSPHVKDLEKRPEEG